VVVGDARDRPGVTCIRTDEVAGMSQVLDYLAALGHRRIGRVAGLERLRHTVQRTEAFRAVAERLGLEEVVQQSDYSGEDSARATRLLLAQRERPTAIVYDNDVMAVAGLAVASEMGVDVPGELSLVSWGDSTLCRITHPAITALAHDPMAYGAHVARRLIEVIDGAPPQAYLDSPYTLVPRGSTSPA
jgi:DNA-binding LacI/PurR family transcriptional regulator